MKIISRTGKGDKPAAGAGRQILKGALALLLILSLFFYRDSLQKIWEGIRQVTVRELSISMLLAAAGYLLEGMTIFCMMGTILPGAAAQDGIFIAFVCEFYRLTTLGNGSGVAEIHYLCQCDPEGRRSSAGKASAETSTDVSTEKAFRSAENECQRNVPKERIAPGSATVLTMIQYVMKRTAIMALGLCAFLVLMQRQATRTLCREYAVFVGISCLITAGIILVFLSLVLSDRMAQAALGLTDLLIRKMPSQEGSFGKWREQIHLLNQSGKTILGQKKRMLCAILIQLGKQLLFYGITAFLLNPKTPLGADGCILLMALSFMLAGVIPAPSGAGALEFVFLLFFTRFTNGETAAVAILLFRFVTWLCPAAAGGVLLAVQSMRRRHRAAGR